jgi:hypothetical protein
MWLWNDLKKTLRNNQGFWGEAASALMGGLGSWLGSQGQDSGQSGYDVVQMPQYDWTESSLGANNEYLMQMLDALKKGQMPSWMNYLNPVQEGMQQNLSNQFYGSAGRSGTLNDVMNSASITGVGPRAAMTKATQASADYLSEADKIDQYISGLKYNSMSNLATQVPSLISQQPQGPQSQIVTYGGGGQTQSNGLTSTLGSLAQNIPWENVFSSQKTPSSGSSSYTSQYGGSNPYSLSNSSSWGL